MKAPPSAQSIVVYRRYAQPGASSSGVPGISEVLLHDNINRYVVGGAAASAPSENLGFYFSGKHTEGWNSTDETDTQTPVISKRLIIADLAEGFNADGWKNETVGKNIPGRPGAEIVWVPVSNKGMLVVIGGSSDLNYLADYPSHVKVNRDKASEFMKTISLYDVDSGKWFQQNTTGTIPPITAEFCAGVVSNDDKSIHNIYIYGGYNGTDFHANRSDDVYVLTLPRFEWVKLYNGTSAFGRAGHRCVVPDPSRMLVIGGVGKTSAICVPHIFRTFDLNEGRFVSEYDPSTYKEYSMPQQIRKVNGLSGVSKRGTTVIKPAKGWSSKELQQLFNTKYPRDMRTWYPYSKPGESHKKHHLPKWVAPFVGVVCGLIGVGIVIAVVCFILRKRRRTREEAKARAIKAATDRHRELMKYCPVDANGYPIQHGYYEGPCQPAPEPAELASFPISELANTAVPIEVAASSPVVAPAELPGAAPRVSVLGPQSPSARFDRHDGFTLDQTVETRLANETSDDTAILDSPLRPFDRKQNVFTASQWQTLLALADTAIPSIQPRRSARHSEHLVLDNEQYDVISGEIQTSVIHTSDQNLTKEYLGECPSGIPAFNEAMRRQLCLWTPRDNVKQLSMVLTALSSKPLSLLLTGSSTPFASQELPERLVIYHSWATSYIPALRKMYKTFNILFTKTWVLCSPTLPKILGMPRVPVHYTPPAEDYPFDFIQLPPGDGVEVLETDAVVVGSGCGGGVTAKNLAEAGHRVIVVDKAYHFSNKHYPMTTVQGSEHLFASGGADVADDNSIVVLSGQAWGGGGTVNWGASLQTQAFVRQEWADEGLSFFTSAEYQASMDRVWDYMGCSTDQVEHNHSNRVTLEGARKLGYAAKPVALNTNHQPHYDGYTSTGCRSGAKQSPAVLWLPKAAKSGAQFIEGLDVREVLFHDASKTSVRGVRGIWRSRDETHGVSGAPLIERQVEIRAKRVVVSGGSMATPLLLLRSGLRNPNIGRNLHLHPVVTVSAIFPYETRPWEGSILTSVCNEFENLDGKGHGIKIENMTQIPGVFLPLLPVDDPVEKKRFCAGMKNGGGFISLCRDRHSGRVYPDPIDGRTRLQYTPSLFDRKHTLEGVLGIAKMVYICGATEIRTSSSDIPVFRRPRSDIYSEQPLNRDTGPTAIVEGQGINDVGFQAWIAQVRANAIRSGEPLHPDRTVFGSAHQMGSCRMGVTPKKSVVDPTGQVWGVKGLYIADASVMPSACGVNPMLTTYAISDWISRGVANGLTNEQRSKL
ncbi:hypothetical protein KEM54_000513 [Ascosphaera aggregata]|nr:hypothetical protein KEM54_000513 [Ascosphaera aggregata]